MRLKYIMVTHWENHWDKLPNDETYYTKRMFRGGMNSSLLVDETPTIFIKLNEKTKEPEKAWEGVVYDIKEKGNRVYFKVKIHREISIPEEYAKYREGWYVEGAEEALQGTLFPPFFTILNSTSNPAEFEKYIHYLLKLLGIHQVFKFESQRGHPDGFFRFGKLAVVYDATLEADFERTKEMQIKNYCSLMKSGQLKYGKISIDISSCDKQVWIITRGKPQLIQRQDDVKVKEVPISELFKIYLERLEKYTTEDELEDRLKNLCNR